MKPTELRVWEALLYFIKSTKNSSTISYANTLWVFGYFLSIGGFLIQIQNHKKIIQISFKLRQTIKELFAKVTGVNLVSNIKKVKRTKLITKRFWLW